ncbi:MAG: HIRAN domain-containing protein [Balneolaceae bacterium]
MSFCFITLFITWLSSEVETDLRRGKQLQLRREPENLHDEYAIEVYFGQHKSGYINRADSAVLALLMDQGIELRAWIMEMGRSGYVSQKVKVVVWMNLPDFDLQG